MELIYDFFPFTYFHSPFMNKSLSKAITIRSKLRNKYIKFNTEEMHIAYKKQRNYCLSLLRKTK